MQKYIIVDGEEFRITEMGIYVIIERKIGELIRDFPPMGKEEYYDHVCMIKKDHIPILRKVLEKIEKDLS